jgi:protein-tyrosine phosphatase
VPEVVFVCYGNICRSPIAEALLARALDERLGPSHDWIVSSAGVGATDGTVASRGTKDVLLARGIDFRRHRARFLTPAIAHRAALIVCMEAMQVTQVQTMVDDPSKVVLMGEGVPDPIGAGPELYEKTAALIESHIPALVERLLASEQEAAS